MTHNEKHDWGEDAESGHRGTEEQLVAIKIYQVPEPAGVPHTDKKKREDWVTYMDDGTHGTGVPVNSDVDANQVHLVPREELEAEVNVSGEKERIYIKEFRQREAIGEIIHTVPTEVSQKQDRGDKNDH